MMLTLKSCGQEPDMVSLVLGDLLQVGVERRIIASFDKLFLGIKTQALAIKAILQMLKSKGIVQDIGYNQLVGIASRVIPYTHRR